MLNFIDANESDSDNDCEELRDLFILDHSTFPNNQSPTQLPGSNMPPPVKGFWNTPRSPSPTKLSIKNAYKNNTVKVSKTIKKTLKSKDYLKIFLAVLGIILFLTSIALLILSILTPSIISSVFAPTLNLMQTQIISGFGIITGGVLGFMQIKNQYNIKIEDYNDSITNNHGI